MRRKFSRSTGQRPYRRVFIIAAEGTNTEPAYFTMFNSVYTTVHVDCLKGDHGSSPLQVLERMKEHLRKKGLTASYEAWLVVDRDQWPEEHLAQLHAWTSGHKNHHFALSNPKFEYWLLLHYEDGTRIASSKDCDERLRRNVPGYEKRIDTRKITRTQIDDAIRRAKLRDNPPCTDWPRTLGATTVYRLVESLLGV